MSVTITYTAYHQLVVVPIINIFFLRTRSMILRINATTGMGSSGSGAVLVFYLGYRFFPSDTDSPTHSWIWIPPTNPRELEWAQILTYIMIWHSSCLE